VYEAIEGNVRRTWLLFVGFVLVVAALGYVFGELTELGYAGAGIAAALASLAAWSSYYYSDRIVLSISGAREALARRGPSPGPRPR